MTASEALGLLGLFMPGEVGYIEDPRNEGTETLKIYVTANQLAKLH